MTTEDFIFSTETCKAVLRKINPHFIQGGKIALTINKLVDKFLKKKIQRQGLPSKRYENTFKISVTLVAIAPQGVNW